MPRSNARPRVVFVVVLLLVAGWPRMALAQSDEERARFAYGEAKRALEEKRYGECVQHLRSAREYLGRPVLRVQGPLVRCHFEREEWQSVIDEAKVYFSLEGADPALVEHGEIGSMLVRAEKELEAKRRRSEELRRKQEALKKQRLARERAERELVAKRERERQLADERRRQREAAERAAWVEGAPARKQQHLQQAGAAALSGTGSYALGAAAFTGGALSIGAVLGGFYLALTGLDDDENGLLIRMSGVGITGLGLAGAYFCFFEWGPDAVDDGRRSFRQADEQRARARQEDALISEAR